MNKLYQFKAETSQAWDLINKSKKITLLTHFKPDADGMSACTALSEIFQKKLHKTVETIYPSEPEAPLVRSPEPAYIKQHTFVPDLLIACDTANYDRLYFPDEFKNIPMINIDHHVSNSLKANVNIVSSAAASTCEELFFIIKQWDESFLDEYVASALLAGIVYDSQTFHTQATTSQTLRVAADLIDLGAPLVQIKNEIFPPKSPKVISLWGDALARLTTSTSMKASWMWVTQGDLKRHELETSALVGLSNFLAASCETDITMLFYQASDNKTKVSLRSKKSDVNALAQKFGGGGHKNASGVLSERPLEPLIQEITKDL